MARETIYHCEGPGCVANVQSAAPTPPVAGWHRLISRVGYEIEERDYCSWDCLMKAAAQVEPPTILPWMPEEIA